MSAKSGQVALGRATPRARFAISPLVFFSVAGLLLITNALSVVGFIMSSDIAQLFEDRSEDITRSYEIRIADLKTEIDRLNSRQYARTGDMNLQMQELVQQQEILAEQHQYVSALARMAEKLGLEPATAAADAAPVVVGPGDTDLASLETGIDAMLLESRSAIDALSRAAQQSTEEIVSGLKKVGVAPQLYDNDAEGIGGPFEPISTEPLSSDMVHKANAVMQQFVKLQQARQAVAEAPVHAPLAGALRISSPFGRRVDPFESKTGFHAGIDFPAPTGTPVMATGAGKVSFAGVSGGYGKMIEIVHANGVISRYAHLSKILVSDGQVVDTKDIIGKVGSTGRSTGPHLHFEIRRADAPVNPQIFLNEGRKLSRLL